MIIVVPVVAVVLVAVGVVVFHIRRSKCFFSLSLKCVMLRVFMCYLMVVACFMEQSTDSTLSLVLFFSFKMVTSAAQCTSTDDIREAHHL